MADNHPQASPTTPENEKSKVVPAETKPIEQPGTVAPVSAPEKKA